MSVLLFNPSSCSSVFTTKLNPPLFKNASSRSRISPVKAFFNPIEQEPLVKEALKEPVAFLGGMFAGLLRLDLNDDPLKEWLQRTVEASGVTDEEINADNDKELDDEVPQQIEIE